MIWDIEDLTKQPPWGTSISADITNLADYFIIGDGENLTAVLEDAIFQAVKLKKALKIESL